MRKNEGGMKRLKEGRKRKEGRKEGRGGKGKKMKGEKNL